MHLEESLKVHTVVPRRGNKRRSKLGEATRALQTSGFSVVGQNDEKLTVSTVETTFDEKAANRRQQVQTFATRTLLTFKSGVEFTEDELNNDDVIILNPAKVRQQGAGLQGGSGLNSADRCCRDCR